MYIWIICIMGVLVLFKREKKVFIGDFNLYVVEKSF